MGEFANIIRVAGPAAGGLLIAFYGVWGGQYAAKFKPPFDDVASVICVAAMVIGIGAATWHSFRVAHRS
jgi:hypothetical protein